MEQKKKTVFRLGVMVLIGLAVLTVIEYYVSFIPTSAILLLFVIAIMKGWAILRYFMHVAALWTEEAHG